MSSGRGARILVVDDDAAMLRAVERVLEREHEVACFASPCRALERAPALRPQVAVVDVQMAEMDGFELTRALRLADPQLRVILMTGSAFGTDEKLVRAIEEEAFYFIHKPFDRSVLRTLVARCLELRRLEDENRGWLRHLEAQMAEARAFQRTMLPAPSAVLEGIEIHTAYHPSTELAGDLCDYAVAGPGQIALVVADVVGHGASAAMLTALVKSAFHAARADTYEPMSIVRRVSESLAAFDSSRFVTLVTARLDLAADRLDYVVAGHEGALLAPVDAGPRRLKSTGPLISSSPLLAALDWSAASAPFPPGARLLFYTDGITEAANGDDELGRQPLLDRLADGLHGDELVRSVLDAVDAHAPEADDDRTLLTARRPAD
ncbi:MAG: fused response regulator/phosphatase [Acidobacteriota bacterium]